jgi:hypothetical protein
VLLSFFFFVTDKEAKQTRAFTPDKFFQDGSAFVSKARILSTRYTTIKCSTQVGSGKYWIILKSLQGTNTIAYFYSSSMTKKKVL